MDVKIAGDKTGTAAAIKMIRSVMIKGIEALTLETFIAATRAGLVEEVTASMKNNYPGLDWAKIAEYNVERMASHGERRAAEMEESARTLREFGIEPHMVEAMVLDHREMGQIGKKDSVHAAKTQGRDALLKAVSEAKGRK
jgi:3-hydroxyisobutyrate dehydrogenase-like beta-hydroxyacid dehydrogenase